MCRRKKKEKEAKQGKGGEKQVGVNFGKLNFWFERVWGNQSKGIAIFNFIGVIYLTTSQNPNFIFLAIGASILCFVWSVIDILFILPQHLTYSFGKNPRMVSIEKKIDALYEKMLEEEGGKTK